MILLSQYREMIADETKEISILSNTSAFIFENLKDLNWAGFYFSDNENRSLYLGPFQGKIACTTIDFERGVCGKSARTQSVIVVDDVHLFEDHIACDSASQSEIVLPVIVDNQLVAVLDIDSPKLSRFDLETQNLLKELVNILVEKLTKLRQTS